MEEESEDKSLSPEEVKAVIDNGRKAFHEAVVNMTITASPFQKDYVFYAHLLAKCKVVFDLTLKAAAGVAYVKDHYILFMNPLEVLAVTDKGEELQGFSLKMPLKVRIGVLKHEMLHIAFGHLFRVKEGDKNFNDYNKASDCSLNQEIDRNHLPDYVIYPDNLHLCSTKLRKGEAKWGQTSEYYYDLIHENGEDDDSECEKGGGYVDGHESWKQSEGDATLQKELTKKMVEDAANQTQKGKGTLPSSYAQMIEDLTVNREINWKQLLRRVVGNKKANTRKTIMRRDRRMPHAQWIKGRVKDRIFELSIISDVSGSVSDSALYDLWGTILDICSTYKVPVNMVQVDTTPSKPEVLTSSTKMLERKACGGTLLAPAIEMFNESGIHFDALVVTTDGYLFEQDIVPFQELNKIVIWLVESGGQIMPEMNTGKMVAVKLEKPKT